MAEIIPNKTNSVKPRWLLMLAIIFFILLITAGGGLVVLDTSFKDKIYVNIYVGNFNLSGQSAEAAKRLIDQEVDKINQRGIILAYKNHETTVTPVISSADGGLAYQIISFNTDQAVNTAYGYGRNGNFFRRLRDKLSALAAKKQIVAPVLVNQEEIIKILKNNFPDAFEPAQDASLKIKKSSLNGDYEFSVTEDKLGKTIDYQEVIGRLVANLSNLNSARINLTTITEYPKILAKNSLNIESQARRLLSFAPLILIYGEKKWTIDQDLLAQMLALEPTGSAVNQVGVGLDENKFKDYLMNKIASVIDKKPVEAKFEIIDGRVTEFQNGQDGLALDIKSNFLKIKDLTTDNPLAQAGQIELAVKTEPVLISAGNINSYGIKEIVGIGASNFAGSPANRRHNIKVGSDSLNGLLIKPGEEFSLLKALGEVASSTGYLPELVIKENRTIPEYGGGLCQVGTTMFRAVIESGLPVTMRRNHSYRVTYYEPAGTDATIYDPWPDFRFINDTPTYILIQTKIASNTLSYEFWGTRDGREVLKTKPTIYNIVKPQPAKIIETLDLKPGDKKCTEKAHNGADAYFDYKVTYPDSSVKEKRFSSHYVPWQEVCLLGVEKLSAPPGVTATSTPPISTN